MPYNVPEPRAPRGGGFGVDGRWYIGGQYEPYYMPRPIMPQIDPQDMGGFLTYARRAGAFPLWEHRDPRALRPHQRVLLKPGKVPDLITLYSPIIINTEDFILDGNHRWKYHMEAGLPSISAWAIPLGFEDAINFMLSYPKCYQLKDHPEKD